MIITLIWLEFYFGANVLLGVWVENDPVREVFLIFVMIQLNKERLTYHFKASDLLRMELTRQFISKRFTLAGAKAVMLLEQSDVDRTNNGFVSLITDISVV